MRGDNSAWAPINISCPHMADNSLSAETKRHESMQGAQFDGETAEKTNKQTTKKGKLMKKSSCFT